MTTQKQQATALDAALDTYQQRAARRPGKKTAAEIIGYTAAAGGLAFAGGDAMGAIVHNTIGAGPVTVTTTAIGPIANTTLSVDLDGAGGIDVIFRAAVGQSFFPPSPYDLGFVGLRPNNSADLLVGPGTDGPAIALALSNTLSGSGSQTAGSNYWYNAQNNIFRNRDGVQFANIAFGSTGYIGVRFDGDTGAGGKQFAWLKVCADYDTTGANHSVSFNVLEWAYDDSGAPLHVADTSNNVPTPATPLLALLGMGAMGIQGYRRRRDQGLKRLADEQAAA